MRAVRAPAGVPALAGPALMDATAFVLGALAAAVAVGALAALGLWRLARRMAGLEAARTQPDQTALLLQQQIESVRGEAREAQAEALTVSRQAQAETLAAARQAQAETLASVRQELHHFTAQMTGQMGQVGTGVQRELQHVGNVMGAVQGSLGKLGEVAQRVFDIGKDIAGLEQILRSPKIRGGLGESFSRTCSRRCSRASTMTSSTGSPPAIAWTRWSASAAGWCPSTRSSPSRTSAG